MKKICKNSEYNAEKMNCTEKSNNQDIKPSKRDRAIFERDKSGEQISLNDPEYYKIRDVIIEAQRITVELNNSYHEEEEVRKLFSKLTGVDVDETFWLLPPFYTDFGKNIRVGKNVFINHACTFMDREV